MGKKKIKPISIGLSLMTDFFPPSGKGTSARLWLVIIELKVNKQIKLILVLKRKKKGGGGVTNEK